MPTLNAQLLQELFIIATGKIANQTDLDWFERRIGPDGDTSDIDALINSYMDNLESQVGRLQLIRNIAKDAVGIVLSEEQAATVSNNLINEGRDTWAKIFHWLAGDEGKVGDTLTNRAAAANHFVELLNQSDKAGLLTLAGTVNTAAVQLLNNIDHTDASLAVGKSGLVQLSGNLTPDGIVSKVVDGYIKGATVFADANRNGVLDAGEWSSVTDDNGNYVLPAVVPAGPIVAFGGTDILTNKAFAGVLTAPAGSTVVNPMTTLVQSVLDSDPDATIATATSRIQTALSLPADIDVLTYDPIKVLAETEAGSAAYQQALQVQSTAMQVVNVMNVAAAALGSDAIASTQVAVAAAAALVDAIDATTGLLDLGNAGSMQGVITNTALTLNPASPLDGEDAAKLAALTSAGNQKLAENATTIKQLAGTGVVATGLSEQVKTAGSSSEDVTLDALVDEFSTAAPWEDAAVQGTGVLNTQQPLATAVLSYSAARIVESAANDGSVDTTIIIRLPEAGSSVRFAETSPVPATIANLPEGLEAVFTRQSGTVVELRVSGQVAATAHANSNDAGNIKVVFDNTAFDTGSAQSVDGAIMLLSIDFNDPSGGTLVYSNTTFTESSSNNGEVTGTATITLSGDTFAGEIGSAVAGSFQAPAGLTAVVVKTSDTTAELSFTGKATAHADKHDTSAVSLTFADAAFTGGKAAVIVGSDSTGMVQIDFNDPLPRALSYSGTTLVESDSNDGVVEGQITVTLSNDTFNTGVTWFDLSATPPGLQSIAAVLSAPDTLVVTVRIAAEQHGSDSDTSFDLKFRNEAFTAGSAATVTGNTGTITVDYIDQDIPRTVSVSTSVLQESSKNDGTFDTTSTVTLTLTGDTFTAGDGKALAFASTLPANLGATLLQTSATTATLTLTGTAANHANKDDVAFTLTLDDSNFTRGSAATVDGATQSIQLDFFDPPAPVLGFPASKALSESTDNNGAIAGNLTITVANDSFSDDMASFVTIGNVPAGLTATLVRTDATTATLSFSGKAAAHANADDSSVTISFAAGAFTGGKAASNGSDSVTLDFADPPANRSVTHGVTTFSEAAANDGSITMTSTITLTNDRFTGANGDVLGTVGNVPAGLTASLTRTSDTTATLSFTGKATAHAVDIDNLTVTFNDGDFVAGSAATIAGATKSDLKIDFTDARTLSYSATTFNEAGANDGSIATTSTITLTNDKFTGVNGDVLGTVSNVPGGLTASLTRASDTTATLKFTGNATAHVTDISNLTVTFKDADFLGGNALGVTGATKADLAINFDEPPPPEFSMTESPSATWTPSTQNGNVVVTEDGADYVFTPASGTAVKVAQADLTTLKVDSITVSGAYAVLNKITTITGAVTVTDTTIAAANLNTLDAKVSSLLTTSATTITGTIADVTTVVSTNKGSSGDKISSSASVNLTVSDAGAKTATTFSTLDGYTTGLVTAASITELTGTLAEIKTVTDAIADSGNKLSLGTLTSGVSNIKVTASDSGALAAADILAVGNKISGNTSVALATSLTGTVANLKTIADASGTGSDQYALKADVDISASDSGSVAASDLIALGTPTSGTVAVNSATTLTGTLANIKAVTDAEGTGDNQYDLKADVAVVASDTGSVAAASLTAVGDKTTGNVAASDATTLTGTLADIKTVTDAEGTAADQYNLNAAVVVEASDTGAVTAADLLAVGGKTSGNVGVAAATAVGGTLADLLTIVAAAGTGADQYKLAAGVDLNATDSATVTAANLLTLAAATIGNIGASSAVTLTGSIDNVKAIKDNIHATTDDKFNLKTDIAITLTTDTETTAAKLNAIAAATTGLVTGAAITKVTGTVSEIKTLVQTHLSASGDKLNIGTISSGVTDAALVATGGASVADADLILEASSRATVELFNDYDGSISDVLTVSSDDTIDIDPDNTVAALSTLVADKASVDASGEWYFNSGTGEFTWYDTDESKANNIKLEGTTKVNVNGDLLTFTDTTFEVSVASSVVTFSGTASGDISLSITGGTGTFTRQSVTAATTVASISTTTIEGSAGVDTLILDSATAMTLTIDAKDGNDKVTLADGGREATLTLTAVESVNGGSGADKISVTSSTGVYIDGKAGNNTLTGGAGNDSIIGGADADVITGGTGADSLDGGDGADVFVYTAPAEFSGGETIVGGSGVDIIRIDGAGTYDLTAGGVSITSIAQVALNLGSQGATTFVLPDAMNQSPATAVQITNVSGSAVTASVNVNASAFTTGVLKISATDFNGDDSSTGGAGHDTLNGGGGNDTLTGGAGSDTLVGGSGNDSLVGGEGSDSLVGDSGIDTLLGGDGNDRITGGADADVLNGGAGDDLYLYDSNADFLNNNAVIDNISDDGGTADQVRITGAITIVTGDDFARAEGIEELHTFGAASVAYSIAINADDKLNDLRTINLANNNGLGATAIVTLTGLTQATTVKGVVSGANTLTGGGGSDTLEGYSAADLLTGGDGNDSITAGNGHNTIVGGAGADSLVAGGGNDFFRFASGAELAGDTTVDGGTGSDTIAFTAVVTDVDDADFNLVAPDSFDALTLVDGANSISLGSNVTAATQLLTVTGGTGDDTINASAMTEAVNISAGDGDNTVTGSNGNDTLTAGTGADLLTGGGGNDSITGGDGNNTIVGGAGADSLVAGGGNDFFRFASGDELGGDATVDGGSGTNTIEFTAAATDIDDGDFDLITANTFRAITLADGTNTLVLGTNATAATQSLTITGGTGDDTINASAMTEAVNISAGNGANVLAGTGQVDTISAGTGADSITGGAGADVLDAGAGDDTYVYAANTDFLATNAVIDSISDAGGTADRVRISGTITIVTGDDFARAEGIEALHAGSTTEALHSIVINTDGKLNDLRTINLSADTDADATATVTLTGVTQAMTVTGLANGASTLTGGGGNDTLTGGGAADLLTGGDGNDSITAGNGNNTIVGGAGADSLVGGTGNDVFRFASGAELDGDTTVDGAAGSDTIAFTAVVTDVDDADFNLVAANTIEALTLVDGTNSISLGSNVTAATQSLTVTGGTGDDTINASTMTEAVNISAGDGANTVTGGSGDDTLTSGTGADLLTGGDGNDAITAGNGNNTIVGGAGADSLVGGSGNDLFRFASGDELDGDTTVDGGTGSDTIAFTAAVTDVDDADFNLVAANTIEALTLVDGTNSISLGSNVTAATQSLTVTGGTGDDTINASTMTEAVNISGGDGANTVTGGSGDDTLTSGTGADLLTGGDGNDAITAGNGNNTIVGGAGADSLVGGSGNDVFRFASGAELDGDTTVDGSTGSDTIAFTAVVTDVDDADFNLVAANTIEALTLTNGTNSISLGSNATAATQSLTITGGTGDDTINVSAMTEAVNISAGDGANVLTGTGEVDTISAGSGTDSLTGGAGADVLDAGAGNDTYVYAANTDFLAANAVIDNISDAGGTADRVRISGTITIVTGDDFARAEGVEELHAGSTTEALHSIVISTDGKLNDLRTINLSADTDADATATVTLTGLTQGMTVTGVASGANTLTGGGGVDTLTGGNGADILSGGAGADVLAGGGGDDTFSYAAMTDFISGDAVVDSISDSAGTADRALISGTITMDATDDLDRADGIEQIVAATDADNDRDHVITITTASLLNSVRTLNLSGSSNAASSGNVNLTGVTGFGVAVTGVSAGANTLTGGSGDDSLTGGSASDTLAGGAGVDSILGGDGNDVLRFASGAELDADATVDGGAGTDTIAFTAVVTDVDDADFNLVAANTIEALTLVDGTNSISLGSNATAATQSLTITGGTGDDTINVSAMTEAVNISAGDGANVLTGTGQVDSISAGTGADSITGGAGADVLDAGAGDDTYVFAGMTDFVSGDAVVDSISDSAGTADRALISGTITMDATDDLDRADGIEQIVAATDADNDRDHAITITTASLLNSVRTLNLSGSSNAASSGNVNLTGVTGFGVAVTGVSAGANTLTGGSGDDSLTGGSVSDTLTGGAGADVLAGGSGDDTFSYAAMTDFISGDAVVDSISDSAGTADRALISGNITMDATDDLDRADGIEQIVAATDADNDRDHVITITTASLLNSVRTLNLSGSSNAASSSNVNLTGVTGFGVAVTGVSAGANTLTGGSGDDSLTGGSVSDTLAGGAGADSVLGGNGDDVLRFASGAELDGDATVDGGAGTDTIAFTAAATDITDDAFNLVAANSIEVITLADGTNSITIGSNAAAATQSLTITGGTGVDTINAAGFSEALRINSGDDADVISAGTAADSIDAGAGADLIHFNGINTLTAADTVTGGSESDEVRVTLTAGVTFTLDADFTGIETLTIEDGSDDSSDAAVTLDAAYAQASLTITASSLEDGQTLTLDASANASGEVVSVTGGAGADSLTGGAGADSLNGGAGIDQITGGDGADSILGGDGNDTLRFASGAELAADATVDGGAGTDAIVFTAVTTDIDDADFANVAANSIEVITLAASTGSNTIVLGSNATAATSTLTINGVNAVSFTDTINAAAMTEAVTINGGSGNDILLGGTQADSIGGGAGNDTITGGEGADEIFGNAGVDLYVYGASVTESNISTTSTAAAGFDKVSVGAGETFDFDAVVAAVMTNLIETGQALGADGTAVLGQLNTAFLSADNGVADVEAALIQFTGFETFLVLDTNADQAITAADHVIQLTGANSTISLNDGNVLLG